MITAGLNVLIARILFERGYLSALTHCPEKIKDAMTRFQNWAGLNPTGELDDETRAELDKPRFCGLPDTLALAATECKWPDADVQYWVRDAFPGLSLEKTWEHMDWVAKQWNAAAGLKMARATAASRARILCTMHRHDGPSGVLADAQLPCGAIGQSLQRYDSSERWDVQIMARLVMLHETGHSLGIPHIGGGNVMAPTYNPALEKLQVGDIAEAQRRYGKPAPQTPVPNPSPTPTPSPTGGVLILPSQKKVIAPVGWTIEVNANG